MNRTHYILIGLIGLWLTGCSSVPPQAPANLGTLESEAAMAAQAGNAAVAAGLYRQLADLSRGSARSGYLISATRFAFELGNLNQTELWLDEARDSAAAAQLPEIDLLSARQLIESGSDLNALELLNRLPAQMPIVLAAESSGLRGRALFALGRYADAVAILVDREIWLDSSAEILANQRLIWDGLRELETVPEPSGNDIVDGWLALAPFTELSGEGTEFLQSLTEWRSRFSNHPAAGGILAELLASQRSSGQRPNRIALLLPMSSARRTLAMAIRDGFLAAHLATEMQAGEVISIYDTSTRGSVDAYYQAQFDGADIIIGPLLREGVDEIIPLAGFIPTLALNYSQQETVLTPPSLYQFALAPEDEARAVAERAIAMGQKRAVALFASTDLGYRLMNSFRQEFESRGGEVLNATAYVPESNNLSAPITELLNITRSEQRHRRLQANLGLPVEFEPRRRQDVDMIFLQADPGPGRLLAPQLRFHNAGDIPTYATSDIHDTARLEPESDLNGILFPDLPLLLTPDTTSAALVDELQTFWPQRARQWIRYYSFGFDAYQLAQRIYQFPAGSWQLEGATGLLESDIDRRIHRRLPFAQFNGGRAQALPALPPPVAPAPNDGTVPEIIFGSR